MSHIISLTNHSKYRLISLILILSLFTNTNAQTVDEPYTTSQKWGFGFAASFGVSMTGFIMSGIMLLILRSKKLTKTHLKLIIAILISFAVGALLGDAIVHITPEVFGAHSHGEEATAEVPATTDEHEHEHEEDEHASDAEEHDDHDEDEEHDEDEHEHEHEHGEESEAIPSIISLLILVGFGSFVLIEKLFEWIGVGHSHGFDDDHHHHHDKYDHEAPKVKPNGIQKELEELKALPVQETPAHQDHEVAVLKVATEENLAVKPVEAAKIEQLESAKTMEPPKSPLKGSTQIQSSNDIGFDLNQNKSSSCFKTFFSLKGRKSSGCMILMADFLHNIMDGLAIGVAFASGKKELAVSTFVAILAHEIPQEIGDMGILIESKFPVLQALCCNGMINFSAIIGTLIGLGIGTLNEAANAYVLAFVAGNFLYISLVSMLPVVMKEAQGKRTFILLFAMIVGFGVNFALLASED